MYLNTNFGFIRWTTNTELDSPFHCKKSQTIRIQTGSKDTGKITVQLS